MDKERIEYYRKLGLKITPQRLAILEYLENTPSHPSAEEIFKCVGEKFPSMSFATVYNTLEILKEKGLIREIYFEPGKKRFDPNIKPHHHMICERCYQIFDVYQKFDMELSKKYSKKFKVTRYQVIFYGICENCQKKS